MNNQISRDEIYVGLLETGSFRIGPWVLHRVHGKEYILTNAGELMAQYTAAAAGVSDMYVIAGLSTRGWDIARWEYQLKGFLKHVEESMPVVDADTEEEAWDRFYEEAWEISFYGKSVRIPNEATIYNGMLGALKDYIDNCI